MRLNLTRAVNQAMVDLVLSFAKTKSVTPAQVALSWLLAQGPHIVPIPGTRSASRLAENAGALNVSLSVNELQELRSAAERIPISGDRYPPEFKTMSGR